MERTEGENLSAGPGQARESEARWPRFFGEDKDRPARQPRRRTPPARSLQPPPEDAADGAGGAAQDMPRFTGEPGDK